MKKLPVLSVSAGPVQGDVSLLRLLPPQEPLVLALRGLPVSLLLPGRADRGQASEPSAHALPLQACLLDRRRTLCPRDPRCMETANGHSARRCCGSPRSTRFPACSQPSRGTRMNNRNLVAVDSTLPSFFFFSLTAALFAAITIESGRPHVEAGNHEAPLCFRSFLYSSSHVPLPFLPVL